jgi:hypothetical protein
MAATMARKNATTFATHAALMQPSVVLLPGVLIM